MYYKKSATRALLRQHSLWHFHCNWRSQSHCSSYTLLSLTKWSWLMDSPCMSTLTTARSISPCLSATRQPLSADSPAVLTTWQRGWVPVGYDWIPQRQKSYGWDPSTKWTGSPISDSLFRHLQSVSNAVAWLITGSSRCDHITPVLRQLH